MLQHVSRLFLNFHNVELVSHDFIKLRQISTCQVLYRRKKKRAREDDEDKPKIRKGPVIISCARKVFNFYKGDHQPKYNKFEPAKFATRGWPNRGSRLDYFTIYPIKEKEKEDDESQANSFRDFGLNETLVDNVNNLNIFRPTEIQKMGIPTLLKRQNAILAAETGCGKTFAFMLPLIQQILEWKPLVERGCNQPLALVIVPSRDLTFQLAHMAKELTRDTDVKVMRLVGGHIKRTLKSPPVKEVDLLIGTIGAVSKYSTLPVIKLNCVRHVVLDEADTLFDDSFRGKMMNFLRRIPIGFAFEEPEKTFPKVSQLTLSSATLPKSLPEGFNETVNTDSLVNLRSSKLHQISVPQKFIRLSGGQRPYQLLKLVKLRASKHNQIIVFTNNTTTCDWVTAFLRENNVRLVATHGNMSVEFRKDRFQYFTRKLADVLVTTDAGSRGLDTTMANQIVNFDFPDTTVDYIHRCGRVGRLGSSNNCKATSFVTRSGEIALVQRIEMSARRGRPVPLYNRYISGGDDWSMEDENTGKSTVEEQDDDLNMDFDDIADTMPY